jgi:hypothetical protein
VIATGVPGPTRHTSSRDNGNTLVDIAEAIVNSHLLLLPPSSPAPPERPA